MGEHRYKCVCVSTEDYGDGPAAEVVAFATLSVIPDGSNWRELPAVFKIKVPVGTRPGAIYRFVLEEIKEEVGDA